MTAVLDSFTYAQSFYYFGDRKIRV